MADYELLRKLCLANGISGDEGDIRDIILSEIKNYATNIKITPLGNIIAEKKGVNAAKRKLMLSAHMDEVGFIITYINDDGTLRFSSVGGVDERILPGKTVLVNKKISGIIGIKPIHLTEKEDEYKALKEKELYIDIGAENKSDAEKYVSIGDCVNFVSEFEIRNGFIKGKALDDRAGCAILISLMKEDLPFDMTFAFTTQEETGLKGAKTASYEIAPDAAIVVESTTAADIAGVSKADTVCSLSQGPVISFMDRRTIYDKVFYNTAFKIADEQNIKCQAKRAVAGGNDAGEIQLARSGVRVLAVSLPCRYLHAPVSVISQEDYLNTIQMVKALSKEIAGGFCE